MRKIPRALAAVAVLALVALPAAAQYSQEDIEAQRPMLSKLLAMSAAQNSQYDPLYETLQKTVAPLSKARKQLCAQLRADLAAKPRNASAIGTDALSLLDNKARSDEACRTFDTAVIAILTSDQATRYQAVKGMLHLDDGRGANLFGDCPPADQK